jgi:hypothetical protein
MGVNTSGALGTALGGLALAQGLYRPKGAERGPLVTVANAGFDKPLSFSPLNRRVTGLPDVEDYYTYGQRGGEHNFFAPESSPSTLPALPAPGGGPNVRLNEPIMGATTMRAGGHYIKGPGSGRSDDIDAKLSNDEYVMDAETVALLGDGSPEEGARRLDRLRENVRRHKGQQLVKGKFSANAKDPVDYLPRAAKYDHSKGGSIRPRVANLPLRDLRRMVAMLEKRTPDYKNMSDAELESYTRWLNSLANMRRPDDTPPVRKAKGGMRPPRGFWVRRVIEGGRSETDVDRRAQLAAVQRFRDALKEQQARTPAENPAPPLVLVKKAEGGAVEDLKRYARHLENLIALGNTERIAQLKDALGPTLDRFFSATEPLTTQTGTE